MKLFVQKGKDTKEVDVALDLLADRLSVTPKKEGTDPLSIPYRRISAMSYERKASTFSTKYLLSLVVGGETVVLRLDRSSVVKPTIAALEERTGLTVAGAPEK